MAFKFLVTALFLVSLHGCGSSATGGDKLRLFDEFSSDAGLWTKDERIAGGISFAYPEEGAGDGRTLLVSLPGDPSTGVSDSVGPSAGNQVRTVEELSYGRYRFRLKAAACSSSLERPEEVITGAFVYSFGGDLNANGITDNDEIDFEFTCSAPQLVSLTVWTDYDEEAGGGQEGDPHH